uniref:Uncharacterized protein n=1 Tax=Pyrococcus abyssi TaxID=29292 RepID=A0A5J6XUJ2_PYRAY|nr:hypothetical protein [Pyrococcus abyssi]QFN51315.1 hypothetical protein [Pyrococcus abyssi]
MEDLSGIIKEIEFYDRYMEKLRRQIDAAQRELARISRLKQQKIMELARLKKARRVTAV